MQFTYMLHVPAVFGQEKVQLPQHTMQCLGGINNTKITNYMTNRFMLFSMHLNLWESP